MTKKRKPRTKNVPSPVVVKENTTTNQNKSFFTFFKPGAILQKVLPYSSYFMMFAFMTLFEMARSEDPNNYYFSVNGTHYNLLFNSSHSHGIVSKTGDLFYELIREFIQNSSCGEITSDGLYPRRLTELWKNETCYADLKFSIDAHVGNSSYAECIISTILNPVQSLFNGWCDTLTRKNNREVGEALGATFGTLGGGALLIVSIMAMIKYCPLKKITYLPIQDGPKDENYEITTRGNLGYQKP